MNTRRIVFGGLTAGVIIFTLEALLWGVILAEARSAAQAALGLDEAGSGIALIFGGAILIGIVLAWLCAALRPCFGSSPWTSIRAGTIVWLASFVTYYTWNTPSGRGFVFVGPDLTVFALLWSLAAVLLAALVAARIYRETEVTDSRNCGAPDSLPDVVNRWLSVQQGSFDLYGYLALFAEDVAFRDAETERTAQGHSELAEAVRPFTQLTDISARMLRHATNEDQVFVEGELTAKTPTGASVTSRGVVVFTVADSRITSLTTYLFRQNVSLEGGSD